jgi:hypothetical protein
VSTERPWPRIDRLVNAGADNRERESEERLEFLALLVEAYEEEAATLTPMLTAGITIEASRPPTAYN